MVTGAVVILLPKAGTPQIGDLIILAAVTLPPIANRFQQIARSKVNAETMMFLRSLLSGSILLAAAFLFEVAPTSGDIRASWLLLFINGFFLFGLSKIFWIEAIHRISVSKAISLAASGPLITMLYAWLLLKDAPTIWQFAGFVPIFFGVVLVTKRAGPQKSDASL